MLRALHPKLTSLHLLIVLEHEDFGTSLFHCKQAAFYAEVAEDADVRVGAAVRQANTLFYRKRNTQRVQTYQEAMPFIERASPLMRGRAYSGLSAALSTMGAGVQQEAMRYMGMAHDTFPDTPENDPGFLYTHTTHYILYLNDTLAYLHFKQPQDAWRSITRAAEYVSDTLSPRRIELLNHQTLASVALGDLEQSRAYFEAAVTSGQTLGSDLYLSDAAEIYQNMVAKWPNEQRVKGLADLLNDS
jgi:tetratricopeptide (TPR) repeat protein